MTFTIQLEDHKHICFKENMNIDEVIYFRIRGNSSSYSFTVKYLSGNETVIAYEHNYTYENEFQQSVYVQAQYDYCIINLSKDYISFDIDYNIGNDVVDLTKIAKKQDLDNLSQQLFEIEKKLTFFKKARGHFISKQEMMSELQNSISKFHIAFSLGCLGLSMIITVITIQLIRRILLQKKVI